MALFYLFSKIIEYVMWFYCLFSKVTFRYLVGGGKCSFHFKKKILVFQAYWIKKDSLEMVCKDGEVCSIKMGAGLPWWRSGWEPWSGKIPHAAERLGPWATITEPARLEPVLHKRGCDSERPAHRDEERSPHRDEEWPPLAATGESPPTNRRPNTAKNK